MQIYDAGEGWQCVSTTVDHRGYIFALKTGTYSLSATTDDILLAWVGVKAYAGWNRANADYISTTGSTPGTYTFDLIAGTYNPIRIMYANGFGAGSLDFSLTDPDGNALLDSTTGFSPNIISKGCEGTSEGLLAPAFSAWGGET
jgi:hypothetical protein